MSGNEDPIAECQLRKVQFYEEILFSSNTAHSELASVDNSDCCIFPFVLHFLGALKGINPSKFSQFPS